MIDLKLNKKELKKLDQYPFLKQYVEHYKNTDGESEDPIKLPKLIVWIRMVIPDDKDPASLFRMNNEFTEDFYSWGSNSRWANTFHTYLTFYFKRCIRICLDLADEYGDREVIYSK